MHFRWQITGQGRCSSSRKTRLVDLRNPIPVTCALLGVESGCPVRKDQVVNVGQISKYPRSTISESHARPCWKNKKIFPEYDPPNWPDILRIVLRNWEKMIDWKISLRNLFENLSYKEKCDLISFFFLNSSNFRECKAHAKCELRGASFSIVHRSSTLSRKCIGKEG